MLLYILLRWTWSWDGLLLTYYSRIYLCLPFCWCLEEQKSSSYLYWPIIPDTNMTCTYMLRFRSCKTQVLCLKFWMRYGYDLIFFHKHAYSQSHHCLFCWILIQKFPCMRSLTFFSHFAVSWAVSSWCLIEHPQLVSINLRQYGNIYFLLNVKTAV